jgi:hypothetical protein
LLDNWIGRWIGRLLLLRDVGSLILHYWLRLAPAGNRLRSLHLLDFGHETHSLRIVRAVCQLDPRSSCGRQIAPQVLAELIILVGRPAARDNRSERQYRDRPSGGPHVAS